MNRSGLPLRVGLLVLLLVEPAFSQDDQASAVRSCTVFCKIGRSVSGGEAGVTPAPQPYVMQIDPGEGEAPVPGKIVATRGVVMAETAAERATRKRHYDAMLRSIVPAAALDGEAKPPARP